MNREERGPNKIRPIQIIPGYQEYPLGSVLVQMGRTRVAVGVWLEQSVRNWLSGSGKGWVTAEYGLLPGSTHSRSSREAATGRVGGRTHEIQRLIGRSLRMAVNLNTLGERVLRVDCDVIQADAGTRTAAITGGFVALALACRRLVENGTIKKNPIVRPVSAISCCISPQKGILLDPDYSEDKSADADMNFVFAGESMDLVEVQGTGEGRPFSRMEFMDSIELAQRGAEQVMTVQREVLGGSFK